MTFSAPYIFKDDSKKSIHFVSNVQVIEGSE